ncbi:unnamed protein product [Bursaphelenchus xylophilus]|uniref:(pine wood nematode) hypothetical protein n=1 Tax=Bursaphelenchus xylophilus TaxID=6326 RepID=A0A1I7S1K2_BURXY|nr:unnamed protein product [Bursaphelenchus xylophilus]CAG9081358.1 unnamed protein product [Bursaphelenchus xylophilus]
MLVLAVLEMVVLIFSVAEALAFGIAGCGKTKKGSKKGGKKDKKDDIPAKVDNAKTKMATTLQTEGTMVEEDPDLKTRSNYHFEDKKTPDPAAAAPANDPAKPQEPTVKTAQVPA